MDKVLVLGAIEPFCDLIKEIRQKGFEPVVCDYYENAPAKRMVEYAYDVSTMDIPVLRRIAKQHEVCGVISAFSDRNLQPGYEIARGLELPTFYTPEIIKKLTDKVQMKEHFQAHNFPIIPYAVLEAGFDDKELERFDFPVIMKPIDAYGSKGIFVCKSVEEVRDNYEKTIRESLNYDGKVLIEEFYPVDEISITAWVKAGKAYVTCIYDVNRNFGEEIVLSSVRFPSKYTKKHFQKLQELTQELTDSFGIQEGPVTVQCYIGEKGLKIGEYLYRLAGGSPYLYPILMGGPNIANMLIDYQTGNSVDYENLQEFEPIGKGFFYDIKVYAKEAGKIYYNVTASELLDKMENAVKVIFYHESGSELSHVSKAGKEVIRIFYYQKENDKKSYKEVLDEIARSIQVTNVRGENITELRYPQRPESLERQYDVF